MSSSKTRFFNPAVVGLIMLSFFLGTSEYTVIGILPEIADGFGISLTQAGNIVSLFAFAYGLGTPFLAAYVGKYNRFRITMLGISLFALCNLICAIAVNYMVFLVFRILTAVVSGTVVSISMTYAEDVASIPEHIPGVIAGVFSGFSIASVIGVPIASTITHVFGWRAAFITIFVATLALLALLFMKLPRQNRLKAGSILEQFKLFLDKRISIGKQNRHPHAASDLCDPDCMSAASSHCHPQSGKRRTGTFYPGCCDVSSEFTAADAFPEDRHQGSPCLCKPGFFSDLGFL